MEEKIVTESVAANISPSREVYVPSSTEKKRAVTMYLLIGIIMVAFNNQKKSDFEYFHLKQALGWWAVFVLLIIITSILMLLPIIKYLPVFIVIFMVTIVWVFIKQSWDGKYSIQEENKLSLFHALGGWIMVLFDIQYKEDVEPKEWQIEHKDWGLSS